MLHITDKMGGEAFKRRLVHSATVAIAALHHY